MINCNENENNSEKQIIQLIDLDEDTDTNIQIQHGLVRSCLYVKSKTLATFETQFIKKLSSTQAELKKKRCFYKKVCIALEIDLANQGPQFSVILSLPHYWSHYLLGYFLHLVTMTMTWQQYTRLQKRQKFSYQFVLISRLMGRNFAILSLGTKMVRLIFSIKTVNISDCEVGH